MIVILVWSFWLFINNIMIIAVIFTLLTDGATVNRPRHI